MRRISGGVDWARPWRSLAFRLTAAYASVGLLLLLLATLGLYLLLVTELNRSTELFLRDESLRLPTDRACGRR